MNWRKWLYETITETPEIVAVVPPASVFAAGSLDGPIVSRPYIVIRLVENIPQLNDGGVVVAYHDVGQIWVYDEPGSYDRIDAILTVVEDHLSGPVARGDDTEGLVCVNWNGRSPEFPDDEMKAITRFGQVTLVGVKAA